MLMMKKVNSKEILAKNLRKFMDKNKHSEQYVHKKTGIAQSTVGRILRVESSATLDSLESIASLYGLQAWQLLVADIDPSNPPLLRNMSEPEKLFYEKIKDLVKEAKLL